MSRRGGEVCVFRFGCSERARINRSWTTICYIALHAFANPMTPSLLQHYQVDVDGLSIHLVDAGESSKPTVLFLHGWPQSWAAFERVMISLNHDYHVVAIDLPGVGGSIGAPPSNDKRTLAKYVHGVIDRRGLRNVTLVGHDIGGQVAYAFLRAYPDAIGRAVLMDIAIPGVDPWDDVKRNPYIWHFAFHAIPELPERLVTGHERTYFDFFYDALSATRAGVSPSARETYVGAYLRPEALTTGFDWYRAFPQDEKDNAADRTPVDVPVLYVRGDKDRGEGIDRYLSGFRAAGLRSVTGTTIANSGHFVADEHPDALAAALREFTGIAR
jgi:pimeloyl-ACP methyl ester carboxylesterase